MIASADRQFAIVTDIGFRQSLWSIRTSDGKGVSHVEFSPKKDDKANGLYYGLAIAPEGTVYAAQGNKDAIAVLSLGSDGILAMKRSIPTRKADFPAGLALDERGLLYVTNNDPILPIAKLPATHPTFTPEAAHETVAAIGLNASVVIYDARAGTEVGRVELVGAVPGTSVFPLAVAALRDGRRVYAASERDAGVYGVDALDAAHPKVVGFISTGVNPDALLLNKSQDLLYVANAGSDTVSIVDTNTDKVISTVLLRPEVAANLAGATPTGLALSSDERTLYVSLGDMNAVAVVNFPLTVPTFPRPNPQPVLSGYLPAGWYPTAVTVSGQGKHLLVANAKGIEPRIPHDQPKGKGLGSPLNLIEGVVSTIAIPEAKEIPALTQRVLQAARLLPANQRQDNPLAPIGLKAGKITHVIYIVKENRTYDQVLGDLPQGNGDPGRCLFGREVTPNQHALAERFVLLDNFYDAGDVSGDGWAWSTQASANEYVARNVPYQYSNRGRRYDFEGQNNNYPTGGFPAKNSEGQPLSDDPRFANGAKPIPDVGAAPGGHLWDLVRRHNLSCRNYGFFASDGVISGGVTIIPDNYPSVAGLQPAGHDLDGITDIDFRRFDMDYPDSDAGHMLFKQTGDDVYLSAKRAVGKHHATSRFSEWKNEFDQMLAKDPTGGAVPAFMTVRFCNDHTAGLSAGKHTPRSMVADNDYAIGQLIDTISHSRIWKNTAVFIIEDDAQNGPDHVDIHRSTCYVVSPYIRAHSVDHSFQNTVSVIKTMELLLGLPPMCQFDAGAEPILDWDNDAKNVEPFTAILPDAKIIAEATQAHGSTGNAKLDAMVKQCATLDFTHADRAPAELLNRIIWASVRGTESEMPETPRGPVAGEKKGKKDDDD
jgi:YVTN family beta-propeller protein